MNMAGDNEAAVEAALLDYASEMLTFVGHSGELGARVGSAVGPLGFTEGDEDTPGHIADRVHPDDLLGVLDLIEKVRATPAMEASIRCRARHRDGSWRIVEAA